jgi:hypothetical protein
METTNVACLVSRVSKRSAAGNKKSVALSLPVDTTNIIGATVPTWKK